MTPVLDMLRDIRELVALDPGHTLYQGLDTDRPLDAEVWDVIAAAQRLEQLAHGWLTQDQRLRVLDRAISDLVRSEVRAVGDVEALTERKP